MLGSPIPERPAAFTPDGAPPGITVRFDAFTDVAGRPWYLSRPRIVPRVAVVHTNAARGEGTTQSQINWGNAASSNTKPHYAINAPTPVKLVPTDRRAIANSTVDAFEVAQGERDCSFWTIAIESADTGTLADPAISDFLTASRHGPVPIPHAELVARILAYESIVWGFPLALPHRWNGTGVAAHTFPFPYPAYTTVRGKTCPGAKKIRTLLDQIIPRAIEIRQAWTAPDLPEIVEPKGPKMQSIPATRLMDTRPLGAPIPVDTVVKVASASDRPEWARSALVNVTVVQPVGSGFVTIWPDGPRPGTSNVNYSFAGQTVANVSLVQLAADGTFVFAPAASACHVVIDQQGWAT